MATPFPFGSGNTLLASQLNAITTLPVSTKTASHTLTIADLGTRVVMNSASATTITVNTSIFGASDVVEILNIGAGVCTITAGTCTVSTSGTLALVQNAGGTLTFISASASVFSASGVASSAGGLVPIVPSTVTLGSGSSTVSANGTVTFTGSTSVMLNGVFSSTYTNYRIVFTALGSSNSNALRAQYSVSGTPSTASYTAGFNSFDYSASAAWAYVSAVSSAPMGWIDNAANSSAALAFDCYKPAVAERTFWNGFTTSVNGATANSGGIVMGMHEVNTAYDGIKFLNSAGTNMTGSVIVYGYAK